MNSTLRPERKSTKILERKWSAAVFALYGRACWLHRRKNPHSKVQAQQAAHVIKKSRMGFAIAFGPKGGSVEPRLGRPLCIDCHRIQELGVNVEDRFSYEDVLEVTLLHNSWAKRKLPLPEREDYP